MTARPQPNIFILPDARHPLRRVIRPSWGNRV
jgi:hypothetical protein